MTRSSSRARYLELATENYAAQLAKIRPDSDHAGAVRYLTTHGISFTAAQKYRLGFVGEPLSGDDRFRNMLAIPYLSASGTQAVKFRSLDGTHPKYHQHHGQKGRLYNANAYFEAGDTVGISEGEIDAAAASEHLGIPTLGAPGANGWRDEWAPLFRDFSRVIVFADGDQAGREFAERVASVIGWRAVMAKCPEGEDVASMCATGRTGELVRQFADDDEVPISTSTQDGP